MHTGWLTYGAAADGSPHELVNHDRTFAYLAAGIIAGDTRVVHPDVWGLMSSWQGVPDYRTPRLDRADWYEPGVPASAQFAGVWAREVTGVDASTLTREVTDALDDGGAALRARLKSREIKYSATLFASTPQGLMHGLAWLRRRLTDPVCDDRDALVTARYLSATPRLAADIDTPSPATLDACVTPLIRTLREVTCTAGPRVTAWYGDASDVDQAGACTADVEWTLTAGDPYTYGVDPIDLAGPLRWSAVPVRTVTFQVVGPDGVCASGPSGTASSGGMLVLADPAAPPVTRIHRPIAPAVSRTCRPLFSRVVTAAITVADGQDQAQTVATVIVSAGAADARDILVDVTSSAGVAVGSVSVAYLPAGATLTVDGASGAATVLLSDGKVLDASSVVAGAGSGPVVPPVLSCDDTYTVTATARDTVDPAASVSLIGTRRWP